MREYVAYGLILIVVLGIAMTLRLAASRRRRDHHSIHYRITPADDDNGGTA